MPTKDDAPLGVVGNLRLTTDGVYAEYLVSGVPFIYMSKEWQDQVADEHAELWRTLPSGASLGGLTAPISARAISRRILHAHPDVRSLQPGEPLPESVRGWVQHSGAWERVIMKRSPRRRIFWLRLPLDYGLAGNTRAGQIQRTIDTIIGRDKDSADSIAEYRERAAEMVRALPPVFYVKPASAEQIWWHWNYTASRHVWNQPLPANPYDPEARIPASAFTPVYLDQSAAALKGRKWFAARRPSEILLRTFRDPEEGIADSYQAFAMAEKFSDKGFEFPRSAIFKVLDDLTTPARTLDFEIHTTYTPIDDAVNRAHNTITNIRDQARQRGRHAMSDDELRRKLASGKELASELKSGSAERGVNATIVLVAAAADEHSAHKAIDEVVRRYRKQNITAPRRKGSQISLWRASVPGSENRARLGEARNPTTTTRFSKFVPLISYRLGNNTGVPLGEVITSPGLRDVALCDLLGAPGRDNPGNLVVCGSPGRGKSHTVKNLEWSWLYSGAGLHIVDPTDAREHQVALQDWPDKQIIDPRRAEFSLDGLRIFPFEDAGEYTVDHLLPQLGFSPMSTQAKRLNAHLEPANRHAHGIHSTPRLIEYLRTLSVGRVAADDDLLVALEGLRAQRLLRALFDETLPVPNLSAQLVIWNFSGMELPTVSEEFQAHLHDLTTPTQRAAMALYGLGAQLTQTQFFSRPTPDILIVEECAPWTHSPGGQKTANKIIRQGRKSNTCWAGITQDPIKDIKEVLDDGFIDQRMLFGFKKSKMCAAALQWCDRDIDRHESLLTNYVRDTSPVSLADHGDDVIDSRHGKVIAGREGEAWYLDEFGGFGKFRSFEAPSLRLAEAFDTNPERNRLRQAAARAREQR